MTKDIVIEGTVITPRPQASDVPPAKDPFPIPLVAYVAVILFFGCLASPVFYAGAQIVMARHGLDL